MWTINGKTYDNRLITIYTKEEIYSVVSDTITTYTAKHNSMYIPTTTEIKADINSILIEYKR